MPDQLPQDRNRTWLLGLLLTICYLIVRLPHLRDLPVFADEATYARWAQVIAADPWHNLWVSMRDAKLPLHYWLLAATRFLSPDPITAGRMLSVFVGAAMIPWLMLLCREIVRLTGGSELSSRVMGALTCGFMITCPLIAMQQRMALAEPLLLTEATALAWLSLRLGRLVAENAPRGRLMWGGISWGVVWGLTLLTKQNFSYLLGALMPLGLMAWLRRDNARECVRRFIVPCTIAVTLGLCMFVPALFTDVTHDLRTRLFYKPVFYPHSATVSRWQVALENVVQLVSPRADMHAQWWPYDPAHPLDEGWLYVYLTPPVFFLTGIALFWMARRRDWRALAFLGGWCMALLGGLTATAGVFFSRYTAVGTLPLLLMVAWMGMHLVEYLRTHLNAWRYALALPAVIAGVFIWPAYVVAWSAFDWRAPTLAASDVVQHITRYSSGTAAEDAVVWLRELSKDQPITVVTGTWIGMPNDFFWLTLQDEPNIHLYWTDNLKKLQAIPGPGMWVGTSLWVDRATLPVAIHPNEPVYYFVPVKWDPDNQQMHPILDMTQFPAGSEVVRVFTNPPAMPAGMPIFEIYMVEIPMGERAQNGIMANGGIEGR